jgi:hypothetical protein
LFVIDIDNIALQQIPDDDVLRELSEQVGNCAMQLGVELGLSMVEIEETLSNYSKDMFSRNFDVLIKWKKSCEVKPTIRVSNSQICLILLCYIQVHTILCILANIFFYLNLWENLARGLRTAYGSVWAKGKILLRGPGAEPPSENDFEVVMLVFGCVSILRCKKTE